MSQKKAQLTQKLVNAFPYWSDIRTDEQSLGFQLLNYIAGQHLDHLSKEVIRTGNNQFIGTAVVSDPDVFFTVQLPQTYEFTKTDDDNTELLYTPPVVTGTLDEIDYNVVIASGNDINGFWLDAIPSRMEIGASYSGQHNLFSGFAVRSPFTPLTTGGATHMANHLSITVSGGSSFIDIQNGLLKRGLVQLDGETREGQFLTEEIPFIQDNTLKTQHDFVSVSGCRVYSIDDPEEAFITVKSGDFNATHRGVAYELDTTVENDPMPAFWHLITSDTLGFLALAYQKYDFSQWDLRSGGYTARSSIVEIELLNEHSQNIHALDLAVEPHSDRLWVVDSTTLYCYDASLPYPDMSNIVDKNYDAMCRIEPDSYYVLRGEQVELDFVWRRPVTGIVKHRAWVEHPNGNKYTLLDGAETAYTTGVDSWVWGEPRDRELRAVETYTLSQRGQYIYSLEVMYTDDTSSVDQRIVTVPYRVPLKQYNLATLGVYRPVVGIDIDSEYKIWVLNDENGKHEVTPHWDIMMIDYKNKTIYLRESYDKVRIY